jgi:DHA3 family macrolide efflux protein-like MFS transporter
MSQEQSPFRIGGNISTWTLNYFPMWLGQAISLIGSRVVQFALIWYLTIETSSATVLALATLVGILPEIVLGPIAGAYVDRWDRQLVMIIADGAVALASWGLAFLFWTDTVQVWQIYAIMFIRAIGGSFHWPAMQASTSLMVPQGQLSRINGLNQALNGGLTIVGPLLGAFLLGLLPLFGVMMVDVGTAVLAVFSLIIVNVPLPKRDTDEIVERSIWSDLRGGMAYILNWRGLAIIIGVAMIIRLLLMPAFSLLPLLISDYFKGTAAQLGLMESIIGVGMLVGGVILSLWGGFRRRIYTTLMGIIITGFSLLFLGFVPADLFVLALASVFIAGLAVPLVDGPMMAILQAKVRPEIQGRVFTLLGSLLSLTIPIGLLVAGPMSDLFSLQIWYLSAGVACVALGVALFFVPSVIRIEEHQEGAAAKELDVGGAEYSRQAT